jgi:hypothetical protein
MMMPSKPATRTIKLSIMAPVTVEMVVEQVEHGWIPKTIIRADYLHTMTPRFIDENADEDPERLAIHWRGYCENNGAKIEVVEAPVVKPALVKIGEFVTFQSASAHSGWRRGEVTKITATRVCVAYAFKYEIAYDRKHGQPIERAHTKWMRLADFNKTWKKS